MTIFIKEEELAWRNQLLVMIQKWKKVHIILVVQQSNAFNRLYEKSHSQFYKYFFRYWHLHIFLGCGTWCYVNSGTSCYDARPSSYGAPYEWSCQACRNKKNQNETNDEGRKNVLSKPYFFVFLLYTFDVCPSSLWSNFF